MGPPCPSRRRPTSCTRSPRRTVVLLHPGVPKVDETTYLGMRLNLSANSPVLDGQAAANPSYVLRPRSSASDSKVSSTLNLLPSSPRLISDDQPPYSKSSPPPGASTTPSSETNSVAMILPMGSP